MQFDFATDLVVYLHEAGLPRKHFDVAGSWAEGVYSRPTFNVGLSEMSEYADLARSLRLRGEPEAAVRRWMERHLDGSNASWVGRNRW